MPGRPGQELVAIMAERYEQLCHAKLPGTRHDHLLASQLARSESGALTPHGTSRDQPDHTRLPPPPPLRHPAAPRMPRTPTPDKSPNTTRPPAQVPRAARIAPPRPPGRGNAGAVRAADHRTPDAAPAGAGRRRGDAPADQRLGGDPQPRGGAVPLSARTGRRLDRLHRARTGRRHCLLARHHRPRGRRRSTWSASSACGSTAKPRTATLGYWVGRRYWGHGVATEAAGRLARWGIANLELDRIHANVATDNPASAAVLRRIGFRQIGEGTAHSGRPRRRAPGLALRGHARRHVRPARAGPRRTPRPSRCCWSPPAR